MSLEEFAREFLITVSLRRALAEARASERKPLEVLLRRRETELRGAPDYWNRMYEFLSPP